MMVPPCKAESGTVAMCVECAKSFEVPTIRKPGGLFGSRSRIRCTDSEPRGPNF